MADGRTHAKWATPTALGLSIAALGLVVASQHVAPVGLALGGWLGWLVDPDLDLADYRTHTEGRIYRRLGQVAGMVWQAYWLPYGWLVRHRSPYSHLPGLGTVIRMAWLLWLPLTLATALGLPLDGLAILAPGLLLGWVIQDVVHLFLDNWKIHW